MTTDRKVNRNPVITVSPAGRIQVVHSGAPVTQQGTGRWAVKSLGLSKEYAVEKRTTPSKAKKKVDLLRVIDADELCLSCPRR